MPGTALTDVFLFLGICYFGSFCMRVAMAMAVGVGVVEWVGGWVCLV